MLKGEKGLIKPTRNESATRIREHILINRGLRVVNGRSLTRELPTDTTGKKSTLILYVEDKCRRDIEDIIWSASACEVAQLIQVNPRTIRRWREIFPCEQYKRGKNNRKLPIPKPS